MSLTSHLKDSKSPVNHFLCKEVFKDTKVASKTFREQVGYDVIKPSWDETKGKYNYSIIGMAFDYRFRYYFGVTERSHLLASKGISRICDGPVAFTRLDDNFCISHTYAGSDNAYLSAQYINSFFEYLEDTLDSIKPINRKLNIDEERALNKCCLVLGYFETIYRAPIFDFNNSKLAPIKNSKSVTDLLNMFEESYIDDLCNLSYIGYDLYKTRFNASHIVLNPTFSGSNDVGGADADIIINNSLIEIKTTIDANKNPNEIIRQLLGYVLLDYSNEYDIKELEIFLPRQKSIVKFLLSDLIKWMTSDENADLTEIRDNFKKNINKI